MRLSSVTTCAARANAASVAAASPASVSTATFDAHDARMCVRRADHRRIRLTGKVDVVRVAPGAGDQARIFPSTYRLADAVWRRTRARSEKRHVRYFSSTHGI